MSALRAAIAIWLLGVIPTIAQGMAQTNRIIDDSISSRILGGNRAFHVHLPLSYGMKRPRRYPVLYVQDGQNVFTSAGPNAGFGWGNWALDETADKLARAGQMREIIIVAVDNSPARIAEYSGHVPAPSLESTNAANARDRAAFERYTQFLITELKPLIDRTYRTRSDAANTGVMGSSMGGICSLALAWEHPEVFGRAACLSGSFQIEHEYFLNSVLRNYRGTPKPIRIYLDSGVMDFTGGDDNHRRTEAVAAELRRIGWTKDLEFYTEEKPATDAEMAASNLRSDHRAEARRSQHNEFYWHLRAWRALLFLFGTSDSHTKNPGQNE